MLPRNEGQLTEDDLSADQRAALAQLAKSALIESAATEVVSIGRTLFKDGEPSDPESQRRYRLYKALDRRAAAPGGAAQGLPRAQSKLIRRAPLLPSGLLTPATPAPASAARPIPAIEWLRPCRRIVCRTATRASCSAAAMPLHPEAVSVFRFIPPCSPIPAKEVPAGDGWLHEVKFDGYRVQVHKVGSKVVMFSRYAERKIMWSASSLHSTPCLFSTA